MVVIQRLGVPVKEACNRHYSIEPLMITTRMWHVSLLGGRLQTDAVKPVKINPSRETKYFVCTSWVLFRSCLAVWGSLFQADIKYLMASYLFGYHVYQNLLKWNTSIEYLINDQHVYICTCVLFCICF